MLSRGRCDIEIKIFAESHRCQRRDLHRHRGIVGLFLFLSDRDGDLCLIRSIRQQQPFPRSRPADADRVQRAHHLAANEYSYARPARNACYASARRNDDATADRCAR